MTATIPIGMLRGMSWCHVTSDAALALLRAIFSDPIQEYKEVREEVEDKHYLGNYAASLLFDMESAIYELFEVLANE